jgi:tetratricopeptide (TPR) repeat protein
MKSRMVVLFVALMVPAATHASDDAGVLLQKALDAMVRNGNGGETSAAERYLRAILDEEPDHLEARWQLLHIRTPPLQNTPLADRTEALAAFSGEFSRLERIARRSNQTAFLHYMTAAHAGLYKAYDRALSEIDRAVALDPRSARFLTLKGRLLVNRGKWTRSDADIQAGIRVLKDARALNRTHPSPFLSDEEFEFTLASALADLSRPPWAQVVEHYRKFIESAKDSENLAFAWNNISIAYREQGDCARAKEAAEKALAIMKFGAAQSNRRSAEFCLEMQKTGMRAK